MILVLYNRHNSFANIDMANDVIQNSDRTQSCMIGHPSVGGWALKDFPKVYVIRVLFA